LVPDWGTTVLDKPEAVTDIVIPEGPWDLALIGTQRQPEHGLTMLNAVKIEI